MKKDYYQILGIQKSASERDVKKAYKRLAIKYHPDRNQGDRQAESKFKEAKEAYEVLTDASKRAAYDQYGHSAFDSSVGTDSSFSGTFTSTADFGDIFGEVFGDIFGNSSRSQNVKGSDLQYNIDLTLEEAVKGILREIRISTYQKCNSCLGSGSNSSTKVKKCTTCYGKGKIHTRKGFFTVQQTCSTCYGKGYFIAHPCRFCSGSGRVKRIKTLSVKIPAGVDTDDKIRLKNEGEVGERNAPSGDLYVQIKVKKHPIFDREENNLYCEVPINFSMAALGGMIEVPTLNGKLKLKIPPETQSGKLFRIHGKGVKSVRNRFIGDLLCRVIVETPVNLNTQQKSLLRELGHSFDGFKGENNTPKSKRFFDGVKKFFDELTRYTI